MLGKTEVNNFLNQASTAFNIADSIPIFGPRWTCPLRIAAFNAFTVGSAAMAGVGLIGQAVQPKERRWQDLTRQGADWVIHGSMEVMRGYAELILGLTFFGSIALFLVQLSKNEFAPIVDYHESPTAVFFPTRP